MLTAMVSFKRNLLRADPAVPVFRYREILDLHGPDVRLDMLRHKTSEMETNRGGRKVLVEKRLPSFPWK